MSKELIWLFRKILSGNILLGVGSIKGLGPGLTPAGDDFNSGLLIALNLVEKICLWICRNQLSWSGRKLLALIFLLMHFCFALPVVFV